MAYSHSFHPDRYIPLPAEVYKWDLVALRRLEDDILQDIEFAHTVGASSTHLCIDLAQLELTIDAKVIEEPEKATRSELAHAMDHIQWWLNHQVIPVPGSGDMQDAAADYDLLKQWYDRRLHEEKEAHADDLIEALAHEAKQQQEITECDVPF